MCILGKKHIEYFVLSMVDATKKMWDLLAWVLFEAIGVEVGVASWSVDFCEERAQCVMTHPLLDSKEHWEE